MHPEQVKSIRNIISFLIDEVVVKVNGLPLTEKAEEKFPILLEKLKINKSISSPIDVRTLTDAFFDAILSFYLNNSMLPPFLDNNRELSGDTRNELTNYLFSYFLELPHKYNIEIPLHNLQIPDFKEDDGKLEVAHLGIGLLHEKSPFNINTKGYLILSGHGYFSGDNDAHGMKPYLQDFNTFLYVLLTSSVITIKKGASLHIPKFHDRLGERTKNIPILTARINNKTLKQPLKLYELPLQVSKFLDELIVSTDKKDHLKEKLSFINKLINDVSEAAKYIKAAMDWYVNALMVMDETMSFIQICMGLEALLGDKREGSAGLTQTLSDRCSYLIGKGMSDRDEIRRQLKKIYELRSAIVHGLKNRISESEKVYVKNATLFLRRAIKIECQYLEYYKE